MAVLTESTGAGPRRHVAPVKRYGISFCLDVDGTLVENGALPGSVIVPAGLPGILDRLHSALDGRLALVTGMSLAEIDKLFAPATLPAIGEHGAEMRIDADQLLRVPPRSQILEKLRTRLEPLVAQFPGVFIERRRTTLTIDYRRTPEAGIKLVAAIRHATHRDFPSLGILSGSMAYVVKPRHCTKGKAMAILMECPPFAGTSPIFIGIQKANTDVFHATRRLGGIGVPVASAEDGGFASAAEVRTWLSELVSALAPSSPRDRRR